MTPVLSVPGGCTKSLEAHSEGTCYAIVVDTSHVNCPGPATKSSVTVCCYVLDVLIEEPESWAYFISAFELYLSVLANDAHNVTSAEGDLTG